MEALRIAQQEDLPDEEASVAPSEAGQPEGGEPEGGEPQGGEPEGREPEGGEPETPGEPEAPGADDDEAPAPFEPYAARTVTAPLTLVNDQGQPVKILLNPQTRVQVLAAEPTRLKVRCELCLPQVVGWVQVAAVQAD